MMVHVYAAGGSVMALLTVLIKVMKLTVQQQHLLSLPLSPPPGRQLSKQVGAALILLTDLFLAIFT